LNSAYNLRFSWWGHNPIGLDAWMQYVVIFILFILTLSLIDYTNRLHVVTHKYENLPQNFVKENFKNKKRARKHNLK